MKTPNEMYKELIDEISMMPNDKEGMLEYIHRALKLIQDSPESLNLKSFQERLEKLEQDLKDTDDLEKLQNIAGGLGRILNSITGVMKKQNVKLPTLNDINDPFLREIADAAHRDAPSENYINAAMKAFLRLPEEERKKHQEGFDDLARRQREYNKYKEIEKPIVDLKTDIESKFAEIANRINISDPPSFEVSKNFESYNVEEKRGIFRSKFIVEKQPDVSIPYETTKSLDQFDNLVNDCKKDGYDKSDKIANEINEFNREIKNAENMISSIILRMLQKNYDKKNIEKDKNEIQRIYLDLARKEKMYEQIILREIEVLKSKPPEHKEVKSQSNSDEGSISESIESRNTSAPSTPLSRESEEDQKSEATEDDSFDSTMIMSSREKAADDLDSAIVEKAAAQDNILENKAYADEIAKAQVKHAFAQFDAEEAAAQQADAPREAKGPQDIIEENGQQYIQSDDDQLDADLDKWQRDRNAAKEVSGESSIPTFEGNQPVDFIRTDKGLYFEFDDEVKDADLSQLEDKAQKRKDDPRIKIVEKFVESANKAIQLADERIQKMERAGFDAKEERAWKQKLENSVPKSDEEIMQLMSQDKSVILERDRNFKRLVNENPFYKIAVEPFEKLLQKLEKEYPDILKRLNNKYGSIDEFVKDHQMNAKDIIEIRVKLKDWLTKNIESEIQTYKNSSVEEHQLTEILKSIDAVPTHKGSKSDDPLDEVSKKCVEASEKLITIIKAMKEGYKSSPSPELKNAIDEVEKIQKEIERIPYSKVTDLESTLRKIDDHLKTVESIFIDQLSKKADRDLEAQKAIPELDEGRQKQLRDAETHLAEVKQFISELDQSQLGSYSQKRIQDYIENIQKSISAMKESKNDQEFDKARRVFSSEKSSHYKPDIHAAGVEIARKPIFVYMDAIKDLVNSDYGAFNYSIKHLKEKMKDEPAKAADFLKRIDHLERHRDNINKTLTQLANNEISPGEAQRIIQEELVQSRAEQRSGFIFRRTTAEDQMHGAIHQLESAYEHLTDSSQKAQRFNSEPVREWPHGKLEEKKVESSNLQDNSPKDDDYSPRKPSM
ncbi:MAG: hypothetical protein SFW66_03145 [Gammaproteobacteria bacterium]|nr:hypothetical protein [Gammaproteobacteria bacterium]